MELFLLVTLPKDYINISGNGTKLPFIFSIEGFHGRQFISGRFFFQCSESCIIKRKLCPVFFVEFILIAALTIVGIYVFVCKVLSGKMYLLIHMRNIIWKSVWNYLDNMLNTTCYNYKEEGAY